MKTTKILLFGIIAVYILFSACYIKPSPKTIRFDFPLRHSKRLVTKQKQGTNGSSVVYNPRMKNYYTFFAGNSDFMLEIFDSEGYYVGEIIEGVDLRGVWYNPSKKTVETNTFKGEAIRELIFKNGLPTGKTKIISKNIKQPKPNSTASYDFKKNEILFLDGTSVKRYTKDGRKFIDNIPLKNIPDTSFLNYTSLIYTGYTGHEIGILNCYKREIYLFDKSTGNYKVSLLLPSSSKTYQKLRFSFANNHVWIFDEKSRIWEGYFVNSKLFPKKRKKKKRF